MRRMLGVIAGIITANLVIFLWELLLQQMPFGRAIDLAAASRPGFMDTVPIEAKWWVVIGWLLGACIGALIAFRIARWDVAGWIVAGFVAAAGIANVAMIPHPLWMQLCAVALPFVGALFAFGLYRRWRAARLHLRH